MKRNQLIDKLVNEGLSVNTLSKLTDNQINILAERMLGEQPTTPTLNISKDNLPAQNAAKQKKQNFVTYESEQKLDEKLVGKQKNIDKNHNGKIDAQDFKILKGQKTQADAAAVLQEFFPLQCVLRPDGGLIHQGSDAAHPQHSSHGQDHHSGRNVAFPVPLPAGGVVERHQPGPPAAVGGRAGGRRR
mgnify:CR=1 FL=1